jgi:Mg2+-importing ATPase
VLLASAFLPFLPMLPMHLLVQNLLYDVSQTAFPSTTWMKNWCAGRCTGTRGHRALHAVLRPGQFGVRPGHCLRCMWFGFGASSIAQQTLFQSGWFVFGVLTQTLVVHLLRTPRMPFVQSRAAAPLLVMTLLIAAAGVFLPMGPLAPYFKLQALPPLYFVWLVGLLCGYAVLTQVMKTWYGRRFGWL